MAACSGDEAATHDYGGKVEEVCTPGESRACYGGPAGTEGVGQCRAGSQVCLAHGRAFGPCEDEVLPAAEVCGDELDQSCDGLTSCGETRWSKRWGVAPDEVAVDVSVGADDAVFLTGYYRVPTDLGGGELPAVNATRDVFVAKLSPQGEHLWSVGLANDRHLVPRAVAATPDGGAVVVASFQGKLQAPGLDLSSADGLDVLVAAFDAEGKVSWVAQGRGPGHQQPLDVAVGSDGSVYVAGYFQQTLEIGGETLESAGDYDAFVVKLEGGQATYARSYGGLDDDLFYAVAVDADGSVGLGGYFLRDLSIGGELLESKGDRDLIVVRLDPTGQLAWQQQLGGEASERLYEAAFDSQGNFVFTGSFSGKVSFGGHSLDAAAGEAIYVASIDRAGKVVMSERLGGSGSQVAYGLAIDGRDRIVLSGYYEGPADMGGAPLVEAGVGSPNIFLVKLEPDGSHLWSRGIGVSGNQAAPGVGRGWRRVAVDSHDDIVLAGYAVGPLDLGDGESEGFGGADIVVAKLAP